ncbi:hypothetical protein Tco_1349374, partial [Tanacetum coccineum]
ETKNKKPSQAPKCILVGPKMAYKPNQEYRLVPKKNTTNSSGKKRDGYQWGASNLDKDGANSNGSSFWNVENSSTGTNPIMDKIEKFENLVINGQAILLDEAGNPLKKVEYLDDHDSKDEVASVDNDMAHSFASERTGFGTQSLLEQWRDSYGNGDYDEDPYDDDIFLLQFISGIESIFRGHGGSNGNSKNGVVVLVAQLLFRVGVVDYFVGVINLAKKEAYAPSMPPLSSLPLTMACDDARLRDDGDNESVGEIE